MNDKNIGRNSLGFCSILTLIFITLKLMKFIDWSWWWVFSPLLIEFGVILVLLLAVVIISLIATYFENK